MVRRDPQTGKFVSDGGGRDWHDGMRVGAAYNAVIPAADLSGGTGQKNVDGEESELIDFSDLLANDEVFHLQAIHVAANLGLPTTATAESSAALKYSITTDPDRKVHGQSDSFFVGGIEFQEDSVDIDGSQQADNGLLYMGNLYAENSIGDSVNGLGAGAAPANTNEWIPLEADLGSTPVYDRDDELYIPLELDHDNISDHAVRATFLVTVHGYVEELD